VRAAMCPYSMRMCCGRQHHNDECLYGHIQEYTSESQATRTRIRARCDIIGARMAIHEHSYRRDAQERRGALMHAQLYYGPVAVL
jgi:hypothetical protein